MRGKKPPLLRGAVVGIGLGLYDNIIIHSVNNILILLSMINSVNVKKNRYVVCVFGICCDFAIYYYFIIFYDNTVYH